MSWHLENSIGNAIWGLFTVVILGVPAFYLLSGVVTTIYDGTRAKSWVQVPATVVHVEFAKATYRYEWQGRKLVGERAGSSVIRGTSELDDWDLRMEALLTEAMEKEKPIMVFVNPANPSESMINNEIRWAVLAAFSAPSCLPARWARGTTSGAARSARAARARSAKPRPPATRPGTGCWRSGSSRSSAMRPRSRSPSW